MNINSLNNPNNIIILAFDILRALFGKYVEREIKSSFINDQWVQVLYRGKQVSLTELLDSNCFILKNDLQSIISIFIENWDTVFSKNCLNLIPINIVSLISYHGDQFDKQYYFSFKEVYRILDISQLLLENLSLNSQDINQLRFHTMQLYGQEEISNQQTNFNKFTKKDSNVIMSNNESNQFGNINFNNFNNSNTNFNNFNNNNQSNLNSLFSKYGK